MSKTILQGENAAKRDARVEKYHADLERFNELVKMSQDKISPEATQEMDCGTTISVYNQETGMPVYRERPCDSYPTLAV
jgi:hypothetical protein